LFRRCDRLPRGQTGGSDPGCSVGVVFIFDNAAASLAGCHAHRGGIPSPACTTSRRALRPLRLFEGAADCTAFCHVIEIVHEDIGLALESYCLMGTHFHLLVRSEPRALARAMQRIKSRYAQEMNRRRDRLGPLFEARYGAAPIESDEHCRAAFVYVAVNPVQAGLVNAAADWPFGSHRAHAGLVAPPRWLLPIRTSGVFASAYTYVDAVDTAVVEIHRRRAEGSPVESAAPDASVPSAIGVRPQGSDPDS